MTGLWLVLKYEFVFLLIMSLKSKLYFVSIQFCNFSDLAAPVRYAEHRGQHCPITELASGPLTANGGTCIRSYLI